MKRMPAAVYALLASGMAVPCLAGDWPQWRGPARDGHVSAGESAPESLPSNPQILWRVPLGQGVSSPIVSSGKVVYEDAGEKKEMLHVADALTGKELWHAEIDDLHRDSQTRPGPRCTPLADGTLVWAQSSRGQLRCFNLANGKEVWATNYVKDLGTIYVGEKGRAAGASRHGYNGPPVLDGDHLIALAGGKDAAVVCFDRKTGAIVWKSQDEMPAYSAPVIAAVAGKRQVICFMARDVLALDPADGKLLWRVDVKTDYGRHAMTPVVAGDRVVVSSFQAGLIGIRVSRQAEGFKAERAWTSKESASNFSSPVAEGQYLFGLGPAKDLLCVDIATGKQIWAKEGYYESGQALMSHAGMLVIGHDVLALTDSGELLLFSADPGGFKQISRVPVCGKNWCNPAYADGKLYLRDEKELKCVQLVP
jgi:outer membrane protein assembly factor BamB